MPQQQFSSVTGLETGTKVSVQRLAQTVLTIAAAAIVASVNSADLAVGTYDELSIDVNLSAITGTTPSYQLIVDRLGSDGVYYPIYTGTALTAVGVITISLGIGAPVNVSFGSTIRIREIISGTTPSVTRSVSIIGK